MSAPHTPEPDPQRLHRRERHIIGDETHGWAIAGASAMARRHIVPAIRSQPPLPDAGALYPITDSNIVGIYSRDLSRARQFADKTQTPHVFVNLSDMLERHDVHCVYVGGHPRHHAQTTLAALLAGKHVLCEAPMALSLEDAASMAQTAANAGLILGVNFVRRADPAIQMMRRLLVQQEYGDFLGGRIANMVMLEPSLQTWRVQRNGGGAVLNRTIQDIDIARYLLRDEVASVSARSTLQIFGYEVEEDLVAHLEMRRTGHIIELRDSLLIPHNPTTVHIYNSAGSLAATHVFVDDLESELDLIHNQRRTLLPLDDVHIYRTAIARFNAAVRGEGQPLATASDGQQNLRVALAVLDAIRSGERITLPPVSEQPEDRSLV